MANEDAIEAVLKARYYQPGETDWLDICVRVCDYITGNGSGGIELEEKYQQYLDVMKMKQFIPNSPVLFNFGTKHCQGSACFVLKVEDNIDSIYTTLHEAAKIFKSGGGCGFNMSRIRPANAPVQGTNGVASGVVSFLKLYDASIETIKQGGKRRGAAIAILNIDHPEIRDFVICKNVEGGLTNFNISVMLNDEFMEAVANDEDWELMWDNKSVYTIKAGSLYRQICESIWTRAEPGVLFSDAINRDNPGTDVPLDTTNPCVVGETLILTDKGYLPIKDCVDIETTIWNGWEWSVVTPEITGYEQSLMEIEFSNGSTLTCTPYHRFKVWTGEEVIEKEIQDLVVGVRLALCDMPEAKHTAMTPYIQISNIKDIKRKDTVYCFNEPKNHTGIFNGIYTCNCGEQPLQPYESCVLGSINLVAMLKDGKIDYNLLSKTTLTAIEFLNDVIDKNEYPLPEIEKTTKSFRKVGLGVMGFADVLIAYGLRYDNTPETLELIDDIMGCIKSVADESSEHLGLMHGGYPNQPKGDELIRNATRLAIAPTGTISMIAGVSSGIEPNFAYVYDRKNSLGTYLQVHEQFEKDLKKECMMNNGDIHQEMFNAVIRHMHETGTIQDLGNLSDGFKNKYVTATDVSPEAHIAIQAAFQRYVDSSISKTINCPESTTVTDIEGYIMSAWKQGIKGLTFYRQNSREDVVLNLAKPNEPSGMETAEEYIKSEESRIKGEFKHIPQECPTGGYTPEEVEKVAFKRPKTLDGKTTQLESGCGRLYITLNYNRGKLYEILIKTAGGGCEASIDAMARMISTNMRNGVPIEQITKQLCKVKCVVAMKKKCDGKSCADVIGKLIKESNLPEFPDSSNPTNKSYLTVAPNSSVFPNSSTTIATSHPYDNTKIYTTSGINTIPNSTYNAKTNIMTIADKNHCPDCGAPIHKSEGCVICSSCGWSRC